MPEQRTLDQLRDEFDTMKLLDAVDQLDNLRGLLADGPNLEPPEVRDDLLKLHTIAHQVINEGYPLSDDLDHNLLTLAGDIECQIGDISEAADSILNTLSELIRLCPDIDELGDDEEL